MRRLSLGLAILILILAYGAAIPLALWHGASDVANPVHLVEWLILVVGFAVALITTSHHMSETLKQYVQAFHDLSPEDADGLMLRLLDGGRPMLLWRVMLAVRSGQVDLEGPPVVHKVGGPAMLNVDHNSVVVTSHRGLLMRILAPGFHSLQSFERVWDVADMRPQRRVLTVDFVTADGMPASCQSSIVCRVASSEVTGPEGALPRFGYLGRAVLQVTTSKRVRKQEGSDRTEDWVTGMAYGVMTAKVREVLERYRLDELLNPQYWLEEEDGPARAAAAPQLLPELESEVMDLVRAEGVPRGVIVERIELGMVRPADVGITRQWLEFWQAKLQKNIDRYTMEATATHQQLAAKARVEAQAMFVNRMLEEVQHLRGGGMSVPPQLVIASFMEVLHSMSDQGPEAQRLLFQQTESLIRVINAIQSDESPAIGS